MSMKIKLLVSALMSLSLAMASTAQAAPQPEDWQTPEAIVHALYEVVSADAGEQRDWDRYRALFIEGAQLSVAMDASIGSGIMAMGAEDLIGQTETAYAASGFHELPLVTRVERHGLLASVMSSFEIRLRRSDEKPLVRGLNHFQLLNDGERWWIVSNIGVMETPSAPLPAEFQAAANQEIQQ